VQRLKYGFLLLTLSLALIFAGNFLAQGALGLSLLLNQLVGPIAIFILVALSIRLRVSRVYSLRNFLLTVASVQTGVALMVSLGLVPQPFVNEFSNYGWYSSEFFQRQMGTMDHPLALSLLLVASITLLASVRRPAVQVFLASWFMVGIFLTQSRTGLVLGAVALAYLLLRPGVRPRTRIMSVATFGIVTALYLNTTLSSGVTSRIAEDNGSGNARIVAFDFFVSQFWTHLLVGEGTYSSYSLTQSNGLVTSLENPFMMFAVDYGLVATVLYFGAMVLIALSATRGALRGSPQAAIIALIVAQTYSSLATESAASAFLWIVLGMASGNLQHASEPDSPATLPTTRAPRQTHGTNLGRVIPGPY
jgi:hypothetical protein